MPSGREGLPELLILRHGETEWNREGRFQGSLDSPLTEKGRAQALAMGRRLAALGVGPATHAALTSPQGRALASARLALGPLGFEPLVAPGLAEIGMGAWSGLARAEIARRWPGPPGEGVAAFYARAPEGEPLAALAERAGAVLASLDRPTVVVTHGITRRVIWALATGLGAEEIDGLEAPQDAILRIGGGRTDVLLPAAPALPAQAPAGNPSPMGG